jgi:plastocyanin
VGPVQRLLLGGVALLGAAAPGLPTDAAGVPAAAAASSRRAPEPTPTESEGVRGTAVTMDGVSFTPERLIVKVGETVTWTNKDPFPHNVVSSDGGFKSEDIAPDGQWQFRATAAGRYPYTCTLHPGMDGMLIVEP